MRLERMLLNNVISVRAYNVCKKNNLSSASEIIDYYRRKGTFRSLDHCGNKSDSELIEFCKDLEGEVENKMLSKPVVSDLSFIEELEKHDIDVINRYIENETRTLSQRSHNALLKHLKDSINLHSLCENIYGNPDFQVMNLHNIGKGTLDELTAYFDNIEGFVHSVYNQKGTIDTEAEYN